MSTNYPPPSFVEEAVEEEELIHPMHMMSPEEAEYLRQKQRRNSRVTSIIVTCLVYAGIILLLALLAIPAIQQDAPQIRARVMELTETQVQQQVTQTVRASPSSPSSSAQLITSTNAMAVVHVPMVVTDVESIEFGDGLAIGMGFGGSGAGIGTGGFGGIPGGMKGRCSPEERMKRLRDGGGNQAVEDAVVKGLRYFKETQNGDGSWGNGSYRGAWTGLALLCYLAHCETPISPEFGQTVEKAITFLVTTALGNRGYISTSFGNSDKFSYEHAIGLYALCEALTFCNELQYPIPNLQEVCEKGMDIILSNQHNSGAWDYSYNTTGNRGGDTSILVWQLQALKAAEYAGLSDSRMNGVVRKALAYLDRAHNPGGTFSYHAGDNNVNPSWRLAGAGAFSYQLWGKGNDRPVRNALRQIDDIKTMDYDSRDCLLYAWYYNANAAFQSGGTRWTNFNNKWRDTLLSGQKPNGGWKQEGGYGAVGGYLTSQTAGGNAEHYRTCLAVLQLCVYYRFLPTGR